MIDVSLLHWPIHPERTWSFAVCYARLRRFLHASKHKLHWHLVCETEGVSERDKEGIKRLCHIDGMNLLFRDGPANLGAGMNAAENICTAPWRIIWQDDMCLLDHLDLSPLVNFLEHQPEYLCIRTGWAHTTFDGEVSVLWRPMGSAVAYADSYRNVNMRGPYPYADEPCLHRADFFDVTGGPFMEGLQHGQSEGHKVRQVAASPWKVATLPEPLAVHAGVPSCIANREYKPLANVGG